MLPLTFKQFHSMQKIQRLQPQIKAIQKKYKDDKQRQQQEIMKFYKENNINPFASCLPLAAAAAGVHLAVLHAARGSAAEHLSPGPGGLARGRSHRHDGVRASQRREFPVHLGHHQQGDRAHADRAAGAVCRHPAGSTLMMSSPTMDKNQRRLMTFMPLIFVFIIVNFPAGLIVYWITTNTWTMGQQFFIKKAIGAPPPAACDRRRRRPRRGWWRQGSRLGNQRLRRRGAGKPPALRAPT